VLQIQKIVDKYKSQIPWRALWHFTLFIGIFIITRFIFLELFETGKYQGIVEIQNALVQFEAKFIYNTLDLFGLSKSLANATMTFANNYSLRIFWGCSGLRTFAQVFIIFLLLPGQWKQKLWFIPSAIVVTSMMVALHLLILSFIIALHPGFFDFAHKYLTKILIYGAMFIMWILWEKLTKKHANLFPR